MKKQGHFGGGDNGHAESVATIQYQALGKL